MRTVIELSEVSPDRAVDAELETYLSGAAELGRLRTALARTYAAGYRRHAVDALEAQEEALNVGDAYLHTTEEGGDHGHANNSHSAAF